MFTAKKILFFLVVFSLVSCSTPSTIRIISFPEEAEVSIVENNGTASFIGKTPLNLTENEIYRNGNRYSQLRIRKENFSAQEIVLMKSTTGSDTSVNVQLQRDDSKQNIGELNQLQEKVASTIARANGLIQSRQYIEAENVMNNFVEQYPSVSVGYDYLGNINYLQKRYQKALKYYNKALSLNPQNAERRLIVEKLQGLVSSSAGENL